MAQYYRLSAYLWPKNSFVCESRHWQCEISPFVKLVFTQHKEFCRQCFPPASGSRMTRLRGLRLVEGLKLRLKPRSPDISPETLLIITLVLLVEEGLARVLPPIRCVCVLGQVTFLSTE